MNLLLHSLLGVFIENSLLIGKYGNTLDAKGGTKLVEKDDEEDSDDENLSSRLLKERKEEEDRLFKHSSTEPRLPSSHDKNYYHMPWAEEKPCLFVGTLFEDERKRLLHSNMIQGISDKLVGYFENSAISSSHLIILLVGRGTGRHRSDDQG